MASINSYSTLSAGSMPKRVAALLRCMAMLNFLASGQSKSQLLGLWKCQPAVKAVRKTRKRKNPFVTQLILFNFKPIR